VCPKLLALYLNHMSAANPAYVEVIDFLASGTTPETLVAFRPSAAVQTRVQDLVARDKQGSLTVEEQQELADTLQLEHLIIMAKAQARQKLSSASSDQR
jgi:hypothetical protein